MNISFSPQFSSKLKSGLGRSTSEYWNELKTRAQNVEPRYRETQYMVNCPHIESTLKASPNKLIQEADFQLGKLSRSA